jgi:hypothetical protein
LTSSSDSAVIFGVGDASSVVEDILEILSSLGDGETLDSFCGLIGILIMDSEISAC